MTCARDFEKMLPEMPPVESITCWTSNPDSICCSPHTIITSAAFPPHSAIDIVNNPNNIALFSSMEVDLIYLCFIHEHSVLCIGICALLVFSYTKNYVTEEKLMDV